jgi:hypothetical protein
MSRFCRVLCAASLAALTACGGGPDNAGNIAPAVNRAAPPTYPEVVERYNQRVDALGSLWARTVLRFWYHDKEGQEHTEQVEGHFQYVKPRKVHLSLSKAGETVAYLGSDETRYWWIELGKGEGRRAFVGTHEHATPERIAELGLPVYPLDLLELVGITPLSTQPVGGERPIVKWSADGRELVVNFPTDDGIRRLILDPATYEPRRVEVADRQGVLILQSEMSDYTTVAIRGGAADAAKPRIAGEIVASTDKGRTRVRLRLHEPEMGGGRPKPAAFDFDRLLQAHGVDDVRDLDRAPVAGR